MENLAKIAVVCGVAFEWLSTGRGPISPSGMEVLAVNAGSMTMDGLEDRLLAAYRRMSFRKREAFVTWLEAFI